MLVIKGQTFQQEDQVKMLNYKTFLFPDIYRMLPMLQSNIMLICRFAAAAMETCCKNSKYSAARPGRCTEILKYQICT